MELGSDALRSITRWFSAGISSLIRSHIRAVGRERPVEPGWWLDDQFDLVGRETGDHDVWGREAVRRSPRNERATHDPVGRRKRPDEHRTSSSSSTSLL